MRQVIHHFFDQHLPVYSSKLLIIILLGTAVLAPVSAAESSSSVPTVAVLENRIESVKNDKALTDAEKAYRVEQLQLAITQNEQASVQKQQAQNYADIFTNSVRLQAEFETEAANFDRAGQPRDMAEASLAKLETQVTRDGAELAGLRKRLAQVDSDIKGEKSFDIEAALDLARQSIQPDSIEPAELNAADDVDRILEASTHYLQQARLENLEQRLLSRNTRLTLWQAERKLLLKKISAFEIRIVQLQTLITHNRETDANRFVAQSKKTLNLLKDEPPAIRELAEGNLHLADELTKLVTRQDEIVRKKEDVTHQALKLQKKYASLSDQVAITALESSPEFAAALRRQRDQLVDVKSAFQMLREQNRVLTASRLAQFRIDALRETDPDFELARIIAELRLDPAVTLTQEREQAVKDLLDVRAGILEKLSSSYWSYIGGLTSLTAQYRAVIAQNTQYADLLDQEIMWMPSSKLFGPGTLIELGNSVTWMVNPVAWTDFGATIFSHMKSYPLQVLLVIIGLFVLLRLRPRLISRLSGMKGRVGNVSRDRMSLTLIALLCTVFLALPGPLAMISVAGLINHPTYFSTGLADALVSGSIIFFILQLASESARKDGLLELHFKWTVATVRALRRNLPWLIAVIIPSAVLNLLIETSDSATTREGLGRAAFIVATMAMAVFAYRVLGRKRGILPADPSDSSSLAEWANRQVRYLLIIMVPLFLAGISIYGYHYTAVQLEYYLLNSALVILSGSLIYCLAQRAFAINERRLTLEKLRAQRLAAISQSDDREEIGSTETSDPSTLELQAIDLQTISKQTKTLLKLVVSVAVGLALWNVWSGIFPAFKPLVNIELWEVLELVDGVQTSVSITLWDLLLALGAIVITFLAAQNISGLLEAAFFSRVPLQSGTSFAVITVAQYLIVITGTVIVLMWLGAQWSKVQWLVAALSVGLGFGLQEIVANFVSGIVILFERPIRIGDTVTLGDQWGTISKIRMRATTIVDFDRREIIVPNKAFVQERLTNWTLTDAITRRKISVGVAYGSDVDLVEKLLLEIADANAKVLNEPPPEAFFLGFGDSSLDFSLRIFVRGYRENAAVIHQIHKAIDREFRANGVVIAFPQRDLHLDSKPIVVQLLDPSDPVVNM